LKLVEIEKTHFKGNPGLRLKASMESSWLTEELANNKQNITSGTQSGSDLFNEMKNRFLSFKQQKFLEESEHFQNLAKGQAPKFMVIACGDSRVCPSNILGFQPGEAFVIRNVANLVPPFENGPTETNAALEFAVNSVLVIRVKEKCYLDFSLISSIVSSSFIGSWVVVGKNARSSTMAAASNLDFDQQCRHCEKESVNRSLMNLLTYPWIEEKVEKGVLSIHGGYYNFVDCTFEKWTLDYEESVSRKGSDMYCLKNREFWA
ncbi:hypothetical protein C3L33_19732, partial [Rhododendron williamsianum]